MKKRIIATTMASVMALGTASTMIVASAAEADFEKVNYADKATLQKLLNDPWIKDIVDGEIENYGSVSGEKFQKAVDFANAVLDDEKATDEDATTALLMVKAARVNLKQYDKEALTTLVEMYRGKYNTENKLNEDDFIYDEDDWKKFAEAFEAADDCKESDDILETTDAYEALDEVKEPEALKQKTKRQIDAARDAYIKALEETEFEYQPWERGTVTDSKVSDYNGLSFAWGVLYQHINSAKSDLMDAYETFTKRKGVNVTTDSTIVSAVDTMNNAASVLRSFKSDFESRNSKRYVNNLLTEYYGQLVYTYNADEALTVLQDLVAVVSGATGTVKLTVDGRESNDPVDPDVIAAYTAGSDKDLYWNVDWSETKKYKPLGNKGSVDGTKSGNEFTANVPKLLSAELKVKSNKTLYYIIDKNTQLPNNEYKIVAKGGHYFSTTEPTGLSATQEFKIIRADSSFVISDYIQVTAAEVSAVNGGGYNADTDDTATTTALTALKAAIDTLYVAASGSTPASGKLADDLATVNGVIDSFALCSAPTGTPAAGLPDKYDAAKAAAETVKQKINDAIAKCTFTSGTGSTLASTDIKAITDAATAYGTAYSNFNTANTAAAANAGTDYTMDAGVTATIAITATEAMGDAVDTKTDDYKTAYDAAVAANAGAAAGATHADTNNVMDLAGEAAFKDNGKSGASQKTDKGLKFFASGATASSFVLDQSYATSNDSGFNDKTTASLAEAMTLYASFMAQTTDQRGIWAYDNLKDVTRNMKAGDNNPKAWNLLYNYLKYALEDEFKADAQKKYKKSDVEKLRTEAEKLLTDTIDTSLFQASHNDLRDMVNAASQWIKLARADGTRYYKEYESLYTTDEGTFNSTDMYTNLKDAYDQLKKEYDAFLYSYGDIITKIAKIAQDVDAGKFSTAVTEQLTKDLDAAAAAFLDVEEVMPSSGDALEDCGLFNDDGTMNKNNRLYTYGAELDSLNFNGTMKKIAQSNKSDKKNYVHYVMQTAYDKLVKDYEDAQKPTDEKDYNVDGKGDAKPDVDDAMALIAFSLKGTYEAKYDYNNDKAVDVDDVMLLIAEALK